MNYLYHYTSVESLALILKNRTFRFSPLSALDDLQEEQVKDQANYGKYVFVSSWTEDKEESIPMWNMYSNMLSGVRIKMEEKPFKTYPVNPKFLIEKFQNIKISKNDFNQYNIFFPAKEPAGNKTHFTIDNLIIPMEKYFVENYYLYNYTSDNILEKVNYTDDQELLIPQIASDSAITIGKLGSQKRKCWAFQKEWRYILRFAPVSFTEIVNYPLDSIKNAYNRYHHFTNLLPFNYYYLELDDNAFKTMEITLSPKISDGYRTIVHLLKKEYNPNIIIKDSVLSNSIR